MLDNPHINYALIAEAEAFYKSAGFQRIEAPWAVPARAMEITAPEGSLFYPHDCRTPATFLVASGEQSLLEYVMESNDLAGVPSLLAEYGVGDEQALQGRFLTITPCFRHERKLDKFTRPYFLKLELFDNQTPLKKSLEEIMDLCKTWFSKHIPCELIETDQAKSDPTAVYNTYDIVSSSGIELGSYGIRHHSSVGKWIYATGCAEPRLSQAMIKSESNLVDD